MTIEAIGTEAESKTIQLFYKDSLEQLLAGIAYIDLRIRWAVARARSHGLDPDDEFRGQYISEDHVDSLLGYELGHSLWTQPNGQKNNSDQWQSVIGEARQEWLLRSDASEENGKRFLFTSLVESFGLSDMEVDALLIALAPEIDPRYERLFSYLHDDVTKKRPSIDLVLNLMTDSFEEKLSLRRLFTDESRLLRSRLLMRFSNNSGGETSLLGQFLRPTGRVVEHLAGLPGFDSGLADCAELISPESVDCAPWLPDPLIARLDIAIAGQLSNGEMPMFAFKGGYGTGKKLAARYLASQLNKPLLMLDLASLEESRAGVREGLRLALRDGQLLDAMLFIFQWDMILEDGRPQPALYKSLLAYPGIVIVAGETTWQPVGKIRRRRILRVSFARGDYDRRLQTWEHQIGESGLPLAHLANHFRFTPGQIADVAATARDLAEWRNEPVKREDLFSASRDHSNQKLADLATKISPRYQWEDIVLPVDTIAQMREMVNTVRQRPVVYGQWGFGQKLSLGKGLSALFAGESGTGKTMAADIMAGELELDLYKIDLSMLVSKYIGETEKNLRKVFSEAETSNAILFFDEADAIFGKRSEVKDSHDRYANVEISYLLQRMESYDGVVILATNMRANLDEAFTRRLHFITEFPFPEASDREVIWKVSFPKQTPIANDVDFRLLAERYRIAGGNIRNIIMAAAFLAADDGQVVGMDHLFHAARREYQKIGRLIDEALFISSIE